MSISRYLSICALTLAASTTTLAAPPETARTAPKWELGLGLGAISTPDYIGSGRQQAYALPAPYVVYRGERIQADRDGMRSTLFETERLELKISVAALPPARDRDIPERDGMPDLDPSFELGPELRWRLWQSSSEQSRWELRLPLRAVLGVDGGGIDSIGSSFSPVLAYTLRGAAEHGWRFGLSAGPVFGDESLHEYYYAVAPRYATPERPAYEVDSGYGGTQALLSLSRRRGSFWFGAFAAVRDLHGAEFRDSPLVEQDSSISAGLAFAYIFARSSQEVAVSD